MEKFALEPAEYVELGGGRSEEQAVAFDRYFRELCYLESHVFPYGTYGKDVRAHIAEMWEHEAIPRYVPQGEES